MGDEYLARVTAICDALPEARFKVSHGAPSWFAGKGRQYCAYRCNAYSDFRPVIWCPAADGVQDELCRTEAARFFAPPYVGPSGWIGMRLDVETDWDEVAAVIADAYRHVANQRQRRALDAA